MLVSLRFDCCFIKTDIVSESIDSHRIGHLFCCRQNLSHFSTRTFRQLSGEFLRRNEVHALVMEMNEYLSDPIATTREGSDASLTKEIVHPEDASQILYVSGLILPSNRSVLVLTATIGTR